MRVAQCDLGRLDRTAWSDRARARRVDNQSPTRFRPGLPGVKLTTYSTKGSPHERGNRSLSAGGSVSGKPPSPAMTQARDGAVVVVRARESREHGEGRQ